MAVADVVTVPPSFLLVMEGFQNITLGGLSATTPSLNALQPPPTFRGAVLDVSCQALIAIITSSFRMSLCLLPSDLAECPINSHKIESKQPSVLDVVENKDASSSKHP